MATRKWHAGDLDVPPLVWLKSDGVLGLSNGDPIPEWSDIMGYASPTQDNASERPAWIENVQNGLPAVRLDGTDDSLEATFPSLQAQPNTFFIVANLSFGSGTHTTIVDGADNSGRNLVIDYNNDDSVSLWADAVANSTATLTGLQVLVAAFNDTASYVRQNGALDTGSLSPGTQGLSGIAIGATTAGSLVCGGDFFEIIVLPYLPTDQEVERIEGYLADRWALTLDASHPYASSAPLTLVGERPWNLSDLRESKLWWHDASRIPTQDEIIPRAGFLGPTTPELDTALACRTVGNYCYVSAYIGDRLTIVDVSDPTSPSIASSFSDASLTRPRLLDVSGDYVFIVSTTSDALLSVDVSTPGTPVLGDVVTDGTKLDNAHGVTVSGNYAYVSAADYDGLVIVDVTDPTNMSILGDVSDATDMNYAIACSVVGNYAYVIAFSAGSLTVVNVTDKNAPSIVRTITDTSLTNVFHCHYDPTSGYLFTASREGMTLGIWDIATDPETPSLVGSLVFDYTLVSVDVSGDYAYVASGSGEQIYIVDISDPTAPELVRVYGGLESNQFMDYAAGYGYANTGSNDTLEIIDLQTLVSIGDGDPVQQIRDRSGEGRDLFAQPSAAAPTLVEDGVNGLPVVRFDGTDDWIQSAEFVSVEAQPATLFFVFVDRNGDDGATRTFLTGDDSADYWRIASGLDTGTTKHQFSAGTIQQLADAAEVRTYLYSVVVNGASSSVYRDGAAVLSGVDLGSKGMNAVTIGAIHTGADPAAMDLCETFAVSGVLSDTDRQLVEGFLADKWGVTLDGSHPYVLGPPGVDINEGQGFLAAIETMMEGSG